MEGMLVPIVVITLAFLAGFGVALSVHERLERVKTRVWGKEKPISSDRVIAELHTWEKDQWHEKRIPCRRCKLLHDSVDQITWADTRNDEHMLFHVSRGYLPWDDVPEGWKTWLLRRLEDFPEVELKKIAHLIVDGVLETESIHEMLRVRVQEQVSILLDERLKVAQENPSPDLSNIFDLEEKKRQAERKKTA